MRQARRKAGDVTTPDRRAKGKSCACARERAYSEAMAKKLFLLDGMALVYRAHFALIARPIFTSKGVNTSALYGFTQTLLDIINKQQPTHLAAAFDTTAPTHREKFYAEYKAQREAMPEDIAFALPHVRRLLDAFRIPCVSCDGYEADDVIATVVKSAEKEGFTSYLVSADKDFGQLVSEHTFLYKPSRMGDAVEILGVPEVLAKWGIRRPEQVIDILALWGDTSDNIPGVPGIGEKTAGKLVSQYDTVENLLAHTQDLPGKVKATLEAHRDEALLSKRLATLVCDAPCVVNLDSLKRAEPDNDQLKQLFIEFEFNSIGRRLFGEDFKAGRGYQPLPAEPAGSTKSGARSSRLPIEANDADVLREEAGESTPEVSEAPAAPLKTLADVPHQYRVVQSLPEQQASASDLASKDSFSLAVLADGNDPKQARLTGIAFCFAPREGVFVPLSGTGMVETLRVFAAVLENPAIEKVGHDLKFAFGLLRWCGICPRGKIFDTMLAHSLIEPDMRHALEYVSESMLGYSPTSAAKLAGQKDPGELGLTVLTLEQTAQWGTEAADLAWQLRAVLQPLVKEKGQERVYYEIEAPLVPVLVDMEHEGIRIDAAALNEFAQQLEKQIAAEEKSICRLAGREFNVNSARQLGEILFEVMKICDKPKKTRTGQYSTDERTLAELAPDHEIVRRLLEYRGMTKLKSTYVDALPVAVWPRTGRVHTTFQQTATATGRLNSQNPNLQNIPIRSERGREIRKAFVPRDAEHLLLSADYSQIELRIIAALTREPAMLDAFRRDIDIHTATAARVFAMPLDGVTPEMRRKAKMVNYGIAYGISAFGLAQRLGIPRREAAVIMDEYFAQFPGIRKYMSDTVAFAREHGYVKTVTGRRRYIRDIRSHNATVRGAAERNAINAPIQGSAADMIKVAMVNIHGDLQRLRLKTRMLLQVHDELVFDLCRPEEAAVRTLVEERMKSAIPLEVPIVVGIGTGNNWLEAH
jgi:DNA polymerase-1